MKNYKKIIYLSALALISISSASLSSFGLNKDGDHYLIGSSADLREFADKVNSGEEPEAKGKLVNDIEFNGGRVVVNRKLQKGDFGKWTPIGTYKKPFEGEFISDGDMKKITGLYIDCVNDYQGLFGYVGEGGKVRNIKVDGSYIKGKEHVGGVAGYNGGTMSDIITSSGCIIEGNKSVGGNVGFNGRNGKMSRIYNNSVAVKGEKDYVGGNVGWNVGSIEGECRNSGAVKGEEDYVGGNVGWNVGSIEGGCRNSGAVKGEKDYVGGNIGWNVGSIEGGCENSGDITGGSVVGGNIGLNERIINEAKLINTGSVNGKSFDIADKIGEEDEEDDDDSEDDEDDDSEEDEEKDDDSEEKDDDDKEDKKVQDDEEEDNTRYKRRKL